VNVDTTYEEFLCATTKQFNFEEITSAHIFSLLSKLCKSKATGLDKISAKLLREYPDLIAESLTIIFNQSLLTGIFPNDWKSVRVTPLYKNSGNFSLLSKLCKSKATGLDKISAKLLREYPDSTFSLL